MCVTPAGKIGNCTCGMPKLLPHSAKKNTLLSPFCQSKPSRLIPPATYVPGRGIRSCEVARFGGGVLQWPAAVDPSCADRLRLVGAPFLGATGFVRIGAVHGYVIRFGGGSGCRVGARQHRQMAVKVVHLSIPLLKGDLRIDVRDSCRKDR